ncbi:unnamed protein product [Ophioblennius macclurei]
MESEKFPDPYEDNRDAKRDSRASSSSSSYSHKHKNRRREKTESDEDDKESRVQSRSKTRTRHSDADRDPDRDRVSDGEPRGRRSVGSFYSEDYENESLSERSSSPYSRSRTPSPVRRRGPQDKRTSNNLLMKTGGVGLRGMSRPQRPRGQPLTQQQRRGVRSQSKESSPPKDLDLVTKRMLSARLLKINELRNAMAELQQRADELQKENRILRQLQARQEKALQRYDDTESEISQLLSRHAADLQVLRERLRRTQERERAADRRAKDCEEQLQRSQAAAARLKKLVGQRELGERDELNRRLEEEKARAQEAERKVKELERSMELSGGSFQRQLAAERKKIVGAHEEIRTLQDELERLTNKLREKERELDTRNIYANRMVKPSPRRDADSGSARKVPSRSSSKAVQTEGRASSLDFPTPPPAAVGDDDVRESCDPAPDEYLSLKELNRADDRLPERDEEIGDGKAKEKQKEEQKKELNALEERAKRLREDSKKEEERQKMNSERDGFRKLGHVQEEVEKWNQESLAAAADEEARRRKDKLLAKMREIDFQNNAGHDPILADPSPTRPTSQRKRDSFVFGLTDPEASGGGRRSGVESDAATANAGFGRRALRSNASGDDLSFGSYAPSFGHSASRASLGFPPPPPREERDPAADAVGAPGKDRKANLMQQLFGTPTANAAAISSPPAVNGVRPRREGLQLNFNSGSSTPPPPASAVSSVHVADSRPAVRAIASFDDDIEELTL